MADNLKRSFAIPVIVMLFFSSFLSARESTGDQVNETSALLNVIHSEQLRGIMQRLDTLAYEREYTALELQKIRERQIQKLVDVTRELMKSSEQLREIAPDVQVSREDLVTFRAMAAQLHRETLDLEESIQHGYAPELDRGYERMRDTCTACHRLFREY